MSFSQKELAGYWKIYSAPENSPESYEEIYLRFTENGLLEWGYEDKSKICVLSFDYRLDNEKIITICPPNPRKEFTPYSFTNDGKLKIRYGNYETIWAKTVRQGFFDKGQSWDTGTLENRQLDYMSLLDLPPTDFQIKRAEFSGVSDQIIINTDALWQAWQYSLGQFASFHADEVKQILERGILASKTCQQRITLLMYIVSDGHIEVIDAMLESGFDINADDLCGFTPLDYASFSKQTDIFELLRKHGAKLGSELKTVRWLRWNERKLNSQVNKSIK